MHTMISPALIACVLLHLPAIHAFRIVEKISSACYGSALSGYNDLSCTGGSEIVVLRFSFGAKPKTRSRCPVAAGHQVANGCCQNETGDCLIDYTPHGSSVQENCDGLATCRVQATRVHVNGKCSIQTQNRWTSFMLVHYACISAGSVGQRLSSACYGSNVGAYHTLFCEGESFIGILFISYGAKVNQTCPHESWYETPEECCEEADGDCLIDENPAGTKILEICNGKTNCFVQAQRVTINNRCSVRMQYKWTTFEVVRYVCIPDEMRSHPLWRSLFYSTWLPNTTTHVIPTNRPSSNGTTPPSFTTAEESTTVESYSFLETLISSPLTATTSEPSTMNPSIYNVRKPTSSPIGSTTVIATNSSSASIETMLPLPRTAITDAIAMKPSSSNTTRLLSSSTTTVTDTTTIVSSSVKETMMVSSTVPATTDATTTRSSSHAETTTPAPAEYSNSLLVLAPPVSSGLFLRDSMTPASVVLAPEKTMSTQTSALLSESLRTESVSSPDTASLTAEPLTGTISIEQEMATLTGTKAETNAVSFSPSILLPANVELSTRSVVSLTELVAESITSATAVPGTNTKTLPSVENKMLSSTKVLHVTSTVDNRESATRNIGLFIDATAAHIYSSAAGVNSLVVRPSAIPRKPSSAPEYYPTLYYAISPALTQTSAVSPSMEYHVLTAHPIIALEPADVSTLLKSSNILQTGHAIEQTGGSSPAIQPSDIPGKQPPNTRTIQEYHSTPYHAISPTSTQTSSVSPSMEYHLLTAQPIIALEPTDAATLRKSLSLSAILQAGNAIEQTDGSALAIQPSDIPRKQPSDTRTAHEYHPTPYYAISPASTQTFAVSPSMEYPVLTAQPIIAFEPTEISTLPKFLSSSELSFADRVIEQTERLSVLNTILEPDLSPSTYAPAMNVLHPGTSGHHTKTEYLYESFGITVQPIGPNSSPGQHQAMYSSLDYADAGKSTLAVNSAFQFPSTMTNSEFASKAINVVPAEDPVIGIGATYIPPTSAAYSVLTTSENIRNGYNASIILENKISGEMGIPLPLTSRREPSWDGGFSDTSIHISNSLYIKNTYIHRTVLGTPRPGIDISSPYMGTDKSVKATPTLFDHLSDISFVATRTFSYEDVSSQRVPTLFPGNTRTSTGLVTATATTADLSWNPDVSHSVKSNTVTSRLDMSSALNPKAASVSPSLVEPSPSAPSSPLPSSTIVSLNQHLTPAPALKAMEEVGIGAKVGMGIGITVGIIVFIILAFIAIVLVYNNCCIYSVGNEFALLDALTTPGYFKIRRDSSIREATA